MDESVMKVLYPSLHLISKKWAMPIRYWKQAMNQLLILFADRVSQRQTAIYTERFIVPVVRYR